MPIKIQHIFKYTETNFIFDSFFSKKTFTKTLSTIGHVIGMWNQAMLVNYMTILQQRRETIMPTLPAIPISFLIL